MHYLKKINLDTLKFIAITVFVICLFAHGFAFFNEQLSHDSIGLLYNIDKETMISGGRFLRPIYNSIKGYFCYPTLNGMLSIIFLIATSYMVIDIFDINNKIIVALISSIMCVNYSVSLLFATYMHDCDAYILSLLLSTSALWVFVKFQKGKIISISLFVASMALYQSYLQFAIFTYLVYLIKLSFKEGINSELIKSAIQFCLVILISMIVYFVCYKVTLSVLNLEGLDSYQNPSNVLDINKNSISDRIDVFVESINKWFFSPRGSHRNWVAMVNKLVLVIIVVLLIYSFYCFKNNIKTIAFICFLTIICPLGMNVITLISNVYHDMTIYSFVLFYVAPLILIDNLNSANGTFKMAKVIQICSVLILLVYIFDSCLYSNEIYLKKDLESKTTLMTMTRIIDRIEQTDGYVLGETPVMFVGTLNASDYGIRREGFDYTATGLSNTFSISYPGVYSAYIKQYLNYPMNLIYSEDVINNILNDEKIQNMPCFPSRGGVDFVGDILVVKLSEYE